jgi:hypothetical protein
MRNQKRSQLEKEFYRLAVDWMVCRLALLGNPCSRKGQNYSKVEWMIGELTSQAEMSLVVKEMKQC